MARSRTARVLAAAASVPLAFVLLSGVAQADSGALGAGLGNNTTANSQNAVGHGANTNQANNANVHGHGNVVRQDNDNTSVSLSW